VLDGNNGVVKGSYFVVFWYYRWSGSSALYFLAILSTHTLVQFPRILWSGGLSLSVGYSQKECQGAAFFVFIR
ncbi:MAG: hypothetical protein O2817_12860, partial [Proteobacteria bacterium]|nr:hypothetical protein [Pseudomonadota bacterium]